MESKDIMNSLPISDIKLHETFVDTKGNIKDLIDDKFYGLNKTFIDKTYSDHLPLTFTINPLKLI